MNLARIKVGDEVQINHKGRICNATVEEVLPHELRIKPHNSTFTWHRVGAREVTKRLTRGNKWQ